MDIVKAILGAVNNQEQKKLPQNIREKSITYKVTKKNELTFKPQINEKSRVMAKEKKETDSLMSDIFKNEKSGKSQDRLKKERLSTERSKEKSKQKMDSKMIDFFWSKRKFMRI